MRVAVLFIDGVGVGGHDPAVNPLAGRGLLLSQFDDGSGEPLPALGRRHLVDATFGLPGRPQSASNQTALYTALEAPRLLGRHVLGFPNAALRALLAEHSIVAALRRAGRTATFANAYPAPWLVALGLTPGPVPLELPARLRRRAMASASALAMAAAQVPFRTFDDALADRALTHDVDGATAAGRGFPVPRRTPAEAARVFWRLAKDFTLFEHFLADEAGHQQDLARAHQVLDTFDAFAREVITTRPPDTCVIVCSDHGNVEDLRTRNHTTNPVAVLTFGAPTGHHPLHTLADVGALVLELAGHD